MPKIRDTSFAYEGTTTDAGLTIPMCSYAAGDLLFAFCAGDTGAPTWGCSNGVGTWTQLFALSNTASLTCWWKYAAASGEGDVVFTSTVSETYSGCLVAVRDVYQGYTGGSPPLSANATATGTRIALPTLTTSADNSLVLAAISGSATAPSIFFTESVLADLVKVDGTAEGLGVGWFFKKAAGLTTAYNAGALVSGAGSKAVIEVRAPAGGATVLPAYTVSDASILLSPQPGIAWDSNTAIAATADTNFGTSIAGKTCNDGTVATAVADIGLDTGAFMSFAGVTNATTANQMSGAEAVVAASRYNVGNRNLLLHFRHATPVNNQKLSPVSSGRGVWAGIKSGATAAANWKVWQVHGGDVPLTPGYVQPIVINAANTDTIATNGTLDNADVRRYGFWTGGIGALTQQASFAQMWAMDTIVIAGGTASEPIDVPAVVQAAAKDKNRFSSILMPGGDSQMLCLQAIQFGNGGTDPLYLDLRNAAIAFPSKKNAAKKLVNYNGTDNAVGYTFYPGSGQTVDLRSAVFSSPSPYHLRFHASTPADAIVPTAGMLVIGAGDVQLAANVPIAGATFSDCPSITQNACAVSGSILSNSKIMSASLADMDNITTCSFTSGGTGHAIEVGGAASTITLTGNTFTGYAASNGSTGNEAIYVNIATGIVTINISGGSTPSIRTAGATVVVNNSKTKTFIGLPSGTEVRIRQGSYTLATDGNVTSGSYAYPYTPDNKPAKAQFTLPGYVFEDINITLDSSDQSFPVTWAPDPSYTA